MNDVQLRREHVIARRQERWTYERIAEELGISGTQVQRLYRAGLLDREKRAAAAAQATATPSTKIDALGLHLDVTAALLDMGCDDLLFMLTQPWIEFQKIALRYPNVTRRTLQPLLAIRERMEKAALQKAGPPLDS